MWWLSPHRKARLHLSPYLDGRLGGRQRCWLEAHLQACSTCQRELAQLKATVAALHTLPHKALPHAFALTPQQVASLSTATRSPWPGRARLGKLRPTVVPLVLPLASLTLAFALAGVLAVDFADLGENGGPSSAPQAELAGAGISPPAEERMAAPVAPLPAQGEITSDKATPALQPEPTSLLPPAESDGSNPLRLAQIALGAALATLVVATGSFLLLRKG